MRAHGEKYAAYQQNTRADGDLIASLQFIATPHPTPV
jgi:hypothetical protein